MSILQTKSVWYNDVTVTSVWKWRLPPTCWHVLCYTKSTMQVWQIPVFHAIRQKCLEWQTSVAPMPIMKSTPSLIAHKINFHLPSAVVQLSWVYSFTCWSPKPSLTALVEGQRFLAHTVGAEQIFFTNTLIQVLPICYFCALWPGHVFHFI